MKYLTDSFDLSMVCLSKLNMIRCKRIKKEDIPLCEIIPVYEDDFSCLLMKKLFQISPHKNNIHIMIDGNDIVYYMDYVRQKINGEVLKINFYEITVDDTECSMCSAKGTIDCKNCGKMSWMSGEEI